ncbi:MAG: hypothetical protein JSV23_09125 [Promethearchaeota archaeon]|nr:MAG: hypothetical protein JSV23_09125 [Candidatus Lokiarchaeota archaeon]
MKNLNTKSLMVITIVFTSVLSMPMVVMGQEKDYDDIFNIDQVNVGIFEGFRGGFGAIFGNHLGYGGKILGSIFETLFLQGLNLTSHEMLDNVFVLSANRTHRIPMGKYNFAAENDSREIYFAPHEYNDEATSMLGDFGHAYCVVEKQGEYNYTIEIGAAVTLIIWDNDRSFITAVTKLLNFFKQVLDYQFLGRTIPVDLIRDGISLLTWFIIHINDIFTGDELFILNPITWQRLDIIPGEGFNITKKWYMTGNDMDLDPLADQTINSFGAAGENLLTTWNDTANSRNDNYMQWLLTPTHGNVAETIWTQFSFDLIQLWIKNFEIHIDIAALFDAVTGDSGGDAQGLIANAFKGCNIDFYLFTHHLAGAFLYNDTNSDDGISANYKSIMIDNSTVNVPNSTELTHRLILGTVNGGFMFDNPNIDPSNKSVSWGIDILDANISAVPLGVDLHSYLNAPQENLDYIHFGFTFEPKANATLGAAHGLVKLNQFFAPWNHPESYGAKAAIPNLDLAILYVSTVLHFELNIATRQQALDSPPETPPELLKQEDYRSTQHKLMIGNYIGGSAHDKLEFVDIAGPEYEYGSESSRSLANASTSIIPLLVWLMEHDRHDTYVIAGGEEVSTFSSDIRIQTELSVMVWAVCYPEFEDGSGIWHDPTFSVYMTFESEGFWALIVLIAGVGLVGVATILIKRRKDRRF